MCGRFIGSDAHPPVFARTVKIKTFHDMIKSEIFASVLRDVCEVTGISERDIMSKSKSEEIVDARHLLVVTLRRSGYYPGMIAERLRISVRAAT